MNIKQTIIRYVRSRKGNALLLSAAGAIAATFGIYFFVALSTLSETEKQRITHLYNAYQMGQAIQAKIDGKDIGANMVNNGQPLTAIVSPLDPVFYPGHFITLTEMVRENIVVEANDVTAKKLLREDLQYHTEATGAYIKYVDESGTEINQFPLADGSDPKITSIRLFVNLAGTESLSINDTLPYDTGDPFYYIVMSDQGSEAQAALINATDFTIDPTVYTHGITSIQASGGPQPRNSVILPTDYVDEGSYQQ